MTQLNKPSIRRYVSEQAAHLDMSCYDSELEEIIIGVTDAIYNDSIDPQDLSSDEFFDYFKPYDKEAD